MIFRNDEKVWTGGILVFKTLFFSSEAIFCQPERRKVKKNVVAFYFQGRRRPKRKYVWFIHSDHQSLVEWSSSSKAKDVNRAEVVGEKFFCLLVFFSFLLT